MPTRVALVAGAIVLAALALWHPAPRPAFQSASSAPPTTGPVPERARRRALASENARGDGLVYVAGAVRRPGLYSVHSGDRAADAIARAGGLGPSADSSAVNLAARTADGDEIYVPAAGEPVTRRVRTTSNAYRRRRSGRSRFAASVDAVAPAEVDVNVADARTLERVPGIGRTIAARIVEMRALDGSFASLDELLDVAGMTQTKLDRARPFLRPVP